MAVYKSQYTGQQIDEGIRKANYNGVDIVDIKGDVASIKGKLNSLSFSNVQTLPTNPLREVEYNDNHYSVSYVEANPTSAGDETELEKISVNGNVYKITHPTQVAKDHLYRHRIRFVEGTLGFDNIGDTFFDVYVLGYSTPFTESLSYVNPFEVAGTTGIYINGEYDKPVFAVYYNTTIPHNSTQWIVLTVPTYSDIITTPNNITFKTITYNKQFAVYPQYTDEVTAV